MPGLRILAVASAGGHWTQIGRLRQLLAQHDTLYVTTLRDSSAPSGKRSPRVVSDASRSEPFRLLLLWLELVRIELSFWPDVVITTGAAPGLIAMQIGKMLGAQTIWIDSIANSEELSMSGRLAAPIADLRLTQWPHLADEAANIFYLGSVL